MLTSVYVPDNIDFKKWKHNSKRMETQPQKSQQIYVNTIDSLVGLRNMIKKHNGRKVFLSCK